MTPHHFVDRWRGSTSTERQSYQHHFLDLCHLVGHPTPAELDLKNKFFSFEAGVAKQSGGQGWADVWYRGHFAIEYKGPDGNLDKAYSQLLQYRESLEKPPLLIVSNIQTVVIHTNFTGTAKKVIEITLNDLLTADGLQKLRNIFYDPESFRHEKTAAQVTEDAAAQFGRLTAHLARWGYNSHDVAHYLITLLFCMFAEHICLVEKGKRDSTRFNRQAKHLFRAIAEGDDFGEYRISWLNSCLFDDGPTLDMDSDGLAILRDKTDLDWASFEPASVSWSASNGTHQYRIEPHKGFAYVTWTNYESAAELLKEQWILWENTTTTAEQKRESLGLNDQPVRGSDDGWTFYVTKERMCTNCNGSGYMSYTGNPCSCCGRTGTEVEKVELSQALKEYGFAI